MTSNFEPRHIFASQLSAQSENPDDFIYFSLLWIQGPRYGDGGFVGSPMLLPEQNSHSFHIYGWQWKEPACRVEFYPSCQRVKKSYSLNYRMEFWES